MTESLVCVTGASGFIASHLVEQLLSKGYRVRGTIRKTADDYPHLTSMEGAKDSLELVQAQLLDQGAFDKAVEGCDTVMHTASPYTLTVNDAQKDLVDPAVNGTTNVLESCAKSSSVKRVVLTSSMAAVTDEPDSNHIYTEDDWNEKSSLTRNPYYYSKTLAEKAAWDFMKGGDYSFDLVVINPFMVIGPAKTKSINTSNQVFIDLLSGAYPGTVDLAWGIVDVRDVAKAHVLAMEKEQAKGRHVCANVTLTMKQLVDIIDSKGHGKDKLPRRSFEGKVGTFLTKCASYFYPKGTRSYLQTNLGRVPNFNNSKIKNELGLDFIPIEQSVDDTIKDLMKWGHVAAT